MPDRNSGVPEVYMNGIVARENEPAPPLPVKDYGLHSSGHNTLQSSVSPFTQHPGYSPTPSPPPAAMATQQTTNNNFAPHYHGNSMNHFGGDPGAINPGYDTGTGELGHVLNLNPIPADKYNSLSSATSLTQQSISAYKPPSEVGSYKAPPSELSAYRAPAVAEPVNEGNAFMAELGMKLDRQRNRIEEGVVNDELL